MGEALAATDPILRGRARISAGDGHGWPPAGRLRVLVDAIAALTAAEDGSASRTRRSTAPHVWGWTAPTSWPTA